MARILVVDDEEHICMYYSAELSEEGHEVFTTFSGHNLLGMIDNVKPEAVVLDIKLVDYNGLELLQDIRNRHHDLPVILCTAYDTYIYDPKAIAADYYVIKSFALTELKTVIQRAIEAHTSILLALWRLRSHLTAVIESVRISLEGSLTHCPGGTSTWVSLTDLSPPTLCDGPERCGTAGHPTAKVGTSASVS